MSLVEVLATVGVGANMTAMSWIMKTLYAMRQEISDAHGRTESKLAEHARRLSALEGLLR